MQQFKDLIEIRKSSVSVTVQIFQVSTNNTFLDTTFNYSMNIRIEYIPEHHVNVLPTCVQGRQI